MYDALSLEQQDVYVFHLQLYQNTLFSCLEFDLRPEVRPSPDRDGETKAHQHAFLQLVLAF